MQKTRAMLRSLWKDKNREISRKKERTLKAAYRESGRNITTDIENEVRRLLWIKVLCASPPSQRA